MALPQDSVVGTDHGKVLGETVAVPGDGYLVLEVTLFVGTYQMSQWPAETSIWLPHLVAEGGAQPCLGMKVLLCAVPVVPFHADLQNNMSKIHEDFPSLQLSYLP